METKKKLDLDILMWCCGAGIAAGFLLNPLLLALGRRFLVIWNCCFAAAFVIWLLYFGRQYRLHKKILYELLGEITREDYLDSMEESRCSAIVSEVSASLKEKIHKKYGDLLATKQLEYSILQSQINPHFLYNTLEAIRSQAMIDRYDELADMVETLSRYYRYCVSNKKNFVLLEEELENIQNYFKIQQFRFDNRFLLTLSVMDDSVYKAVIPKMTLQPLVENAVFHGLEQKKEGGLVNIKIYRSDMDIHIFVSDNGCGMPFERVVEINHSMIHNRDLSQNSSKSTGIAMVNVNSRIKLQYGEEYGVGIYSTLGKGTDVEVSMPFHIIRESKELL